MFNAIQNTLVNHWPTIIIFAVIGLAVVIVTHFAEKRALARFNKNNPS